MTVQSDASYSTARRTPPPSQRSAIPASDLTRSQHVIHNDRFDYRPRTDELHDGDKLVLPSIEGQEHLKTLQHNPVSRPKPPSSHFNHPQGLLRSKFVRREEPSRGSDIIDLTSPDDQRDAKRRRIGNPFFDESKQRQEGQIVPHAANERRYVPAMSANLDRPPGYRQYPPADPDEQHEIAIPKQLGYGLEPVYAMRRQPPVPLFNDAPASRHLEVLHHPDEIYHSPSDRESNAAGPRLRSLKPIQSYSDLAPRRTSFVPSNHAGRVSVQYDRIQNATPLEVLPPGHETRDYRTVYTNGETSIIRQPVIEVGTSHSAGASGESADSARSFKLDQPPRYRELEHVPRDIVEYVQPDGMIREYISGGRSTPTYRRVPLEVGEGERPREPHQHMLSAEEITRSAAPSAYRRYALLT